VSSDGKLTAVKGGRKLWELKTGHETLSSPVVAPDGTLYLGSGDGRLHAVRDGKELWDFSAGGETPSSPAVGPDGSVFVAATDGNLYGVRDGMKIWEHRTGDTGASSPVVTSNGTVHAPMTATETLLGGMTARAYGIIALTPPSVFAALRVREELETEDAVRPEMVEDDEWLIIDDVKLAKKEVTV
jgi:outer membrane protein assembly factor BamB